jgi:hypothetical protein
MGIEPMTPVLPRLCATSAPHGQDFWVGSERFELPKHYAADLQSAPVGHFGNCPKPAFVTRNTPAYFPSDRRNHYSRPFVRCQAFWSRSHTRVRARASAHPMRAGAGARSLSSPVRRTRMQSQIATGPITAIKCRLKPLRPAHFAGIISKVREINTCLVPFCFAAYPRLAYDCIKQWN